MDAALPDGTLYDEPDNSLRDLVRGYGAGMTLRALARVLAERRLQLRIEGELPAARMTKRAARRCEKYGDLLRDADV